MAPDGAMDRSKPFAMNPQAMASQPFFYYNPEPSADPRQQGLFTPHPSAIVPSHQLPRYPHPMYVHDVMERPASAQMYLPSQHPAAMAGGSPHGGIVSPRPLYQKPTALFTERPLHLDTDCAPGGAGEAYMYPATPPLSMSGSSISSPPMSSGMLPTPTGPVFFSENIEGVKEGCEVDVKSEILAGGDWARCGSPPLAPGESPLFRFHSTLLPAQASHQVVMSNHDAT